MSKKTHLAKDQLLTFCGQPIVFVNTVAIDATCKACKRIVNSLNGGKERYKRPERI